MFNNSGIAFKLRFYILTGIILIFSSIMVIDYQASRKILMKTVRQNASNLALSTVNSIENVLTAAEKIPENLTPILENIHFIEAEIEQFMKPIVENNSEVFGCCIAFEPYGYYPDQLYFAPYYYKEGDSIKQKNLGNDSYQYFYHDWYQTPKSLGKPVWTEPYFDENGGGIVMATYSVPFYSGQGINRKLKGIVTVDIDLSWLETLIDSINIIENGYAILISKRGTFLTHPMDSLIMNESIFSLAEQFNRPDLRQLGKSMIGGETGFIKHKPLAGHGNDWLYYTGLPSSGWSLGIFFPEEELFADLHTLFITLMMLAIGGIILIFIVITVISKRITKPIEELAATSVKFGTGNFDIVLPPIKNNDEIGMLTNSFEMMRKELKNYMQNLEETTAAKNKIESELKIAHDIQQGIIPKIFPPFPDREDVDLFAILDPAREVGGDLYDFFFLDDNNLVFAIGDVSGKGVPASLFMAITRTLLRAKAIAGKTVSEIVSEINIELCTDNDNAMFVTFFLGIINLETGDLEFCNAGHNYPYILRKNCVIEKLHHTHGTPLGLFDTIKYKSANVRLDKSETIVLYTDGIPEAMDVKQELMGDKRFEDLLNSLCSEKSPKDVTNKLLEATRTFALGAEQSDDITILVLTYYLNKVNKNNNEKYVDIRNKVDDILKVESFIEQLCDEWGIKFGEMHKINLAMEEVISNIINYGYNDEEEHIINIKASFSKDVLKITIEDDAKAFNPLDHKDTDNMDKPIEEREIGGLGIFFIKKMMDRVEYRHESNHNILIIEKMILTPKQKK